ncbi:hypothetical protein AXF42_Ash017873 [Apostasia shenzhenica]|uniref:Pre-rRNA-processing protein RIX1 N-terminal domain-containing protein n=1 Tax=Apostasia shenzhenica TaxID=1088818 RepID=A0A2I0AY37_9ASPA|nr:hypothetical protein AXF42_Ash017873 [Apostasia shenzhenica]
MPASMEFVSSMDDCRLKVRMLQSVVRESLPDEKRPFGSPADMGAILSQVLTFGLLSERYPDPADHKLVDGWMDAVDLWSERIILLASNRVPDKGWAGVGFLGVTCGECSPERFQSSYSLWFQKLLEIIQIYAFCFGVTSYHPQAILSKLLAVVPCVICLRVLSDFAIQFQVEAELASKIMAAKCDSNTLKKFAQCLAHLPNVKADGDSWCLIMQKILVVINSTLTDAFQGLEEEKKGSEVMKMIATPGKETPPLGGQQWSGEALVPATKRFRELLVPRVTSLMHSLCIMLTKEYPVQVSIPVSSLLATVGRVLSMDGSLSGMLFPFATPLHQELLCAELPVLHLGGLNLLTAIIRCLESQLLPYGSEVMRLLTDYFSRAKLPSLRIKAYSIVQMLLVSMGSGMALCLEEEVVKNAFADLADHHGTGKMLSSAHSSAGTDKNLLQIHQKKRKRALISAAEYPKVDLDNKPLSHSCQAPLSVKIAALKALETLLTVGGSLKSELWRPPVDRLLIIVATNAYDVNWANKHKFCMLTDQSSYDDFQLAASEALLTSLLSPTRTQPQYLSQGFNLFVRGKQQTGTKLASFCAHAILVLEAKNSKFLPLVYNPSKNFSNDNSDFSEEFLDDTFNRSTLSRGDLKVLADEDKEVSKFLLNDEQISVEYQIMNDNDDKHVDSTEQPLKGSEDITRKHLTDNTEEAHLLEGENVCSRNLDDLKLVDNGEEDVMSRNEACFYSASGSLLSSKADNCLNNSDIDRSREDDAPKRLPDLKKDSKLSYDSDDSSMDSLPDIVDADPDTE